MRVRKNQLLAQIDGFDELLAQLLYKYGCSLSINIADNELHSTHRPDGKLNRYLNYVKHAIYKKRLQMSGKLTNNR